MLTHGNHGTLGTRSLSYYNYRHSKALGLTHNDKINLPKSNNTSISSRLLGARINDYNLSNNRSVVDHNISYKVDYDNYWEGLDVGNNSDDEKWDNEADTKQSYSNVSVASKEESAALEENIKDITNKIKNISLNVEQKRFWSEFYKRRPRSTHEHTKDTKKDVLCPDSSNILDDFNNLSDTVFEDVDDYNNINSHSLVLHTRDSIGPHGLGTKDTSKKADESISESNVDDRCNDVTDARLYREIKVGASTLRDTVVKDMKLETLRKPSQVRFNHNLENNSNKIKDDNKENTDSNKIVVKCECADARQTVTSSPLLRRLHVYEKICTNNK